MLIPFMAGVVAGSMYEYALIQFNFYDHLRLGSARKIAEERDRIDAAVDRLAVEYPDKFHDLPERWRRIKDYEDRIQQ